MNFEGATAMMEEDEEAEDRAFLGEEKLRELSELRDKIYARIRGDREASIELQGNIFEFAQDIRGKYPDFQKHRLYHMLIGSTPDLGQRRIFDDFPDGDSVEGFLDRQAERFGAEREVLN